MKLIYKTLSILTAKIMETELIMPSRQNFQALWSKAFHFLVSSWLFFFIFAGSKAMPPNEPRFLFSHAPSNDSNKDNPWMWNTHIVSARKVYLVNSRHNHKPEDRTVWSWNTFEIFSLYSVHWTMKIQRSVILKPPPFMEGLTLSLLCEKYLPNSISISGSIAGLKSCP